MFSTKKLTENRNKRIKSYQSGWEISQTNLDKLLDATLTRRKVFRSINT